MGCSMRLRRFVVRVAMEIIGIRMRLFGQIIWFWMQGEEILLSMHCIIRVLFLNI